MLVQNGDVSMFDLDHKIDVDAEAENGPDNEGSVEQFRPTLKFKAHGGLFYSLPSVIIVVSFRINSLPPTDAIGSVSFHPLHPLLLSVSGSRHFSLPSSRSRHSTSSQSESCSDSTSESEDSDEQGEEYGDEDEELSREHTSVN